MQQKYLKIIRGSSNYALSNNSTFSQVQTGSMVQLLCTYVHVQYLPHMYYIGKPVAAAGPLIN
jgi:hypothetical protein